MFVCVSMLGRDVPGGPVIKTLSSDAGSVGSIPGRGAKIPHASWPKNKTRNRNNLVTNSIKTKNASHF